MEFSILKEVNVCLIIKKREYPAEIKVLEALLRRGKLNEETREKIRVEIRRREAGYQGEKRLDYFLSLLAADNYFLLNNLRMEVGDHAFEIDTVMVTNYFILLLDAKNYSGSLYFDQKLKTCTRTYKDQVEAIPDPLSQAYLHNYQMKNFWKLHKLTTLPILSLVIVTHPSTTFSTNPGLENELNQKVIHADHLIERLGELNKAYPNRRLSDKQARDISHYLFKNHKPRKVNVLEKLQVTHSAIQTGVLCPQCQTKMDRKSANWICPQCQTTSKSAHEQAIYDNLLLFGSISTTECQHFLGLKSIHVARRLLKNMNLSEVGTTKDRRYQLPQSVSPPKTE